VGGQETGELKDVDRRLFRHFVTHISAAARGASRLSSNDTRLQKEAAGSYG
jgi:hypothetical protein